MREAADLGVKWVWMGRTFGRGSVCDDATVLGPEHGVIAGGGPLMFRPTSDAMHRIARLVSGMTGKVLPKV